MSVKQRTRRRVALLLAGIGAVVGVMGLAADWSDGLQRQAEDLLQPGTDGSDEIVVVEIDRSTLGAVGESWPWPRSVHAELIDAIAAGGPTAIAYDVLFADERDDDVELIAAIERAPLVLASALTLRDVDGPPVIVDDVEPADGLAAAAAAVGHANVTLTPDRGVVRSLPLYALDERGLVHPALSVAVIATAEGASQYIERPDGLQIGDRFVPLDDGALRVNWASDVGVGSADDTMVVSAIDVLDGRIEPGVLADKIVVVGVTEPTLGDLHLVPTDKSGSTSGVFVHANALNTMLNESYLDEVNGATHGALVVSLAVAMAIAFVWLALRWALVVAVAAGVLVVALSAWRFHGHGELWNIVWPLATIVVVGALGSAARYVGEIRHRRRAADLFSSYVPAGTLDQLADPAVLGRAVAGERLPVTVLFCDLRGFTPIAASLSPAQVRELLDIYYEYAVEIIAAHDGTVMQFVGDEVFAAFGAPVPAADDTARAVSSARALVDRVGDLDTRLAAAGLPAIRFGIGVHRGSVVAAHVGGETHRQYTVIGDAVNVGSRLCGQAGGGEVVVSDAAFDDRPTDDLVRIDGLGLKGVDDPVTGWMIRAEGAVPRHG